MLLTAVFPVRAPGSAPQADDPPWALSKNWGATPRFQAVHGGRWPSNDRHGLGKKPPNKVSGSTE